MLWRGILPGTVVTNSILLRHCFLVRKRLKRTSHLCKDPSLLSLSSHLGHSFLTLASPSSKQGRELHQWPQFDSPSIVPPRHLHWDPDVSLRRNPEQPSEAKGRFRPLEKSHSWDDGRGSGAGLHTFTKPPKHFFPQIIHMIQLEYVPLSASTLFAHYQTANLINFQLVASPTDLIKTQVQMEGRRRRLGKPPRVNGAMDALK